MNDKNFDIYVDQIGAERIINNLVGVVSRGVACCCTEG